MKFVKKIKLTNILMLTIAGIINAFGFLAHLSHPMIAQTKKEFSK